MTFRTTNRVAKAALKAHKKDFNARLNSLIRTTWELRIDAPPARQVDNALIAVQHECKKLNDFCLALRKELDPQLGQMIEEEDGPKNSD